MESRGQCARQVNGIECAQAVATSKIGGVVHERAPGVQNHVREYQPREVSPQPVLKPGSLFQTYALTRTLASKQ